MSEELNSIMKLIDFKIKFFQVIWSDFFEINAKIYFPDKFILKDIVNFLKQKLESLIKIDNYILIKLDEKNLEIYKKNAEIVEKIEGNEKLRNQLYKIPDNITNLNEEDYSEVYNFFNIKNIFGFNTNELYYKNNDCKYVILLNSKKESIKSFFNFFTFKFCYSIKFLIIKTIEILLSVQLEINLSYLEIFREIFDDILIEIFNNFKLINIFKIYEILKNKFKNMELSDDFDTKNKNSMMYYGDGVVLLNNVENSFKLNSFINKKLNDITKFQSNYISLINNFKLWRNIDNYSIMFFNSDNILLFYNFINSSWFNIDNIKHEILEISLDYNKSYNMTNKSLDINGICKNNFFLERVDSIVKNMLNNNMNYFEISNPFIIFQIHKSDDLFLGYSLMIKSSLNNNNFSEENFWKKFNFVIEKNKFDNCSTIQKKISDIANIHQDSFIFNKKNVTFNESVNNDIFKRKRKKINNFYDNESSNINSPNNNSKSININVIPAENIDKSILMEFVPDSPKNLSLSKKDKLKNRKSLFVNHFINDEIKSNFSKSFEKRKNKYKDSWLSNLDNIIYSKENELLDLDKFIKKKPGLNEITDLPELEGFDNWNFDTLELNENELCKVIIDIMDVKNWFGLFGIEKSNFLDFLWKCNFYYGRNKNYFHNFKHGVTVAHSLNQLYKIKYINLLLDDEQKFALFISALGHDLDHRGKTNSFEINTISDITLIYHDKSPLEQHHCYILFKILSVENTNLFKQFNNEVYKNLREIIINSILYTDMKLHFELVSELKLKLENNNVDTEKDFYKLCGFTLHVADLNGPSKNFEISLEWSKLLNKEFIEQYEEEQKLNISLTPHFKDLKNPITYHNNEYKFMKFLIIPLYDVFNNLIEEDFSFNEIYQNTFTNMNTHYDLYLEKEKEKNELNN